MRFDNFGDEKMSTEMKAIAPQEPLVEVSCDLELSIAYLHPPV